jgi:hypothetical protein
LNMIMELVTHVGNHPTADEKRQLRIGKIRDTSNREYANDRKRQNEQYGLVPIGEDVVKNFLGKIRNCPV